MSKRIILLVIILAVTISAQTGPAAVPINAPISLTADESQAIQAAISNEQTAMLAYQKAQAERAAAIYRAFAEHGLKPSEWDLAPTDKGLVFVKKAEKK